MKEGYKITPAFDLPEGIELRDDCHFVYLYHENELKGVFNSHVNSGRTEEKR